MPRSRSPRGRARPPRRSRTWTSGASRRSCGSASSRPGTQMNAYAVIVGSSGWLTENGMIAATILDRRRGCCRRDAPGRRGRSPSTSSTVEVGGVAVGEEHVARAPRRRRAPRRGCRSASARCRHASGRASGASSRACTVRKLEAVPRRLVLDRVDEAVVALAGRAPRPRWCRPRPRRLAPRRIVSTVAQRERAAVGVGVVLEHPHRDRAVPAAR